jgi:hypothetical protein
MGVALTPRLSDISPRCSARERTTTCRRERQAAASHHMSESDEEEPRGVAGPARMGEMEEDAGLGRMGKAEAMAHGQGTFYGPTWAYRSMSPSTGQQHLVLTGPRTSLHGLIINWAIRVTCYRNSNSSL